MDVDALINSRRESEFSVGVNAQQGRIGVDWRVLGTGINDRVLKSAVEATSPVDRLRQTTSARLRRCRLRGEGNSEGVVQMQPRLRERVRFGQLNLCAQIEGLGPFDIVFLRDVLIGFDVPTKIEVVDRVLQHLKAEGSIVCKTPLQALAPGAVRKVRV